MTTLISKSGPRTQPQMTYWTRHRRHRVKRTVQYGVLLFWSLLMLFPIYWTLASSLKTPVDVFAMPPKWFFVPTFHNYEVVFGLTVPTELEGVTEAQAGTGQSQFPRYLLNTVIISLGSTLLSLALGCTAAYTLARAQLRSRRAIMLGVLVTRMIPPVVILVPIYVLWRNLHLLNSHLGMIFAFLTFNLPFTIWMMHSFFVELPVELEEAALVDGCSRTQALIKIVLPLAAPGLVATSVFLMLGAWNEFLFASVLAGGEARMLAPSILAYITDKAILWGRLYAASSVILLPVLILTFIVQRFMGKGLIGGALKG
ncbi:MAG TPA: carbohydrate ABC transporter permease [Caldilineaceae bacterium]|nr:carbohydrate ABC transporter permease [Caldilineaceae bacterium]